MVRNYSVKRTAEGDRVEDCFSCPLPECLPDHPLCPFRDNRRVPPLDIYHGSCFWCEYGRAITTSGDRVPSHFFCTFWGEYKAGYISNCVHAKMTPQTALLRKRWLRDKRNVSTGVCCRGDNPVCVGNRPFGQDPRTNLRAKVEREGAR